MSEVRSRAGRRPRRLLVVAIVLVGLNLRTAVTSVGPVLDEIQDELALSGTQAGILTTLPVIAFAGLGAATPWVARRVGAHRTIAFALAMMIIGLALRAVTTSPGWFLLWSVLALAGGAIGNVTLPVIVKRDFPDRIGPMTATYTTAVAVGTTIGAALTVPLAHLGGDVSWRRGLGLWAVFAAVAVVPWLGLLREPRRTDANEPHVSVRRIVRSPTAWWLTIYFGVQSAQAYIAFGWFAQFFRESGVSAVQAGALVAVVAAVAIPVSVVIPTVASRQLSQRGLMLALAACYAIAYAGMAVAPVSGAWVWVVLVGIGGAAFPLALTLIALRSRTAATTSTLSAFVQAIGYVLAGSGPLLVGALHSAPGAWTGMFVVLYALLAVMIVAGWFTGASGYVDDDLPPLAE